MIQVDLITGFLGAGKTTFIKKYVKYLVSCGKRVGIIENDYGAINVDMMLLQDALGDAVDLEMVAGGCDADCHRRRFKTKLIALGMQGYDRVIVEPSGIFDVDEFFDVLHESPLDQWYEIGNVLAIVDSKLEPELSKESDYMLCSQISNAGRVILSKCQLAQEADIAATKVHLQEAINRFHGTRELKEADFFVKDWRELELEDYESILSAGYSVEGHVKLHLDDDSGYQSLFFMNLDITKAELERAVENIFRDESCGKVFRVKGFVEEDVWYEVNATRHEFRVKPMSIGQHVIIVIGESMDEQAIGAHLQ
ncbi:MAG: GTPase (G3E family) [Lachnospiraceae bacterium]|nr:GTPase (G3E family) [Lachnospiraceae bacterium]